LEMVQLLLEGGDISMEVWIQAAVGSIQNENIQTLKWVASKISTTNLETEHVFVLKERWEFNEAAMNSSSEEVFQIWEKYFSDMKLAKQSCLCHFKFIRPIVSPIQELRLAALWKERVADGRLSMTDLGGALKTVAETCCSVVLATILVDLGVDVDYKTNKKSTAERTPLHVAARKKNAAAAELMKYLLLAGADPNTFTFTYRGGNTKRGNLAGSRKRETETPSMEKGAQNISKWLGMTWDQLVEWAQEQRKTGSENEGENV